MGDIALVGEDSLAALESVSNPEAKRADVSCFALRNPLNLVSSIRILVHYVAQVRLLFDLADDFLANLESSTKTKERDRYYRHER